MLAAIDRQRRSGDEVGFVGDQEKHAARDILAPAKPSHGNLLDDFFQNFRRHRTHHVGVDIAGRDCVDRDALCSAFLRQGLRKAMNAGLGSRIVDLAVLACLAVDRSDIHDPAELSFPHAVDNRAAHVEA